MKQDRVSIGLFFTFVCATLFLCDVPPVLPVLLWVAGLIGMSQFVALNLASWQARSLYVFSGLGIVIPAFQLLAAAREDDPYWKILLLSVGITALAWQVISLFLSGTAGMTTIVFGLASLFGTVASLTSLHPALQVLWALLATGLYVFTVEANHEHAEYLQAQTYLLRFSILAAAMSAVLLLLWPVEEYFMKFLSLAQLWAEDHIVSAIGNERGMRLYPRIATLDSIAFEQRSESMNLALRVKANFQPGYLRGAAYDTFQGRQWTNGTRRTGEMRTMRLVPGEPAETFKNVFPEPLLKPDSRPIFTLREKGEGPWHVMEVNNQPRRGDVFFTPREAHYAQGAGTQIWVDRHDVIRRGLDVNHSYRLILTPHPQPSILDPTEEFRLTNLPGELAQLIGRMSQEICAGADDTSGKIEKIETYFHDNYNHSLDGFETPPGMNSLEYFLLNKPDTHCEYFATAAALMLRAQGVPARYVTGYLVREESSDSNGDWSALNRDAHAWVEAFDRDSGQWTIVEATAGVSVSRTLSESLLKAQQLRGASTAANQFFEQLDHDDSIFYFRFSPQAIKRFVTWLSIATLLGFGGYYGWHYWKSVRRVREASPERQRLRRLLQRVDRKLQAHRTVRPAHETLQQFAVRLRSTPESPEWFPQAATWYDRYARLVYSTEPVASDVDELASTLP